MKAAITILLLVNVGICHAATTWYVSKSGSDSNSGKSESAALLTIQKAIDKAAANDTILVAKGTYSYITIPASKRGLTVKATGSVADSVIKGASGHRCVTIGDGSTTNIYVVGFTLTSGSLSGSGNCGAGAMGGTYSNCVITANSSGSLTTGSGAYKCTLNNCTISNNTCSDWTGGIEDCIANKCTISGNKSTNVGAGGAKNCMLTECTISGNTAKSGGGGAQGCTSYRCVFKNNTCTSNSDAGNELNGGVAYDCIVNVRNRAISAASCYNCTIVSTSGSPGIWRATSLYNCIVSSSGNSFTINGDSNWSVKLYNCLLNNVSLGTYVTKTSCTTANPKFVSNSDYHLQAGSPCIDKGNNSYVSTTTDYAGNVRIRNSKVDIGAYEYYVSCTVEDVSASQRYPWNGLVDVKFKIGGESGAKYNVSLSARDVIGGTNVAMKTVRKKDQSAVNVAGAQIAPGTYNWIWDAAADLPKGWKCDRVTVKVSAE